MDSNEWAHKRLKRPHFVVLTAPQANDREDLRRFFKLFLEEVLSEVRMQHPAANSATSEPRGGLLRAFGPGGALDVVSRIDMQGHARCGSAIMRTDPAQGDLPLLLGPGSGAGTLALARSSFTPVLPPNLRPTFTNLYILTSSRDQLPHVVDNLWISAVQHRRTCMRNVLVCGRAVRRRPGK